MFLEWTVEDEEQWTRFADGAQSLYSAWVDKATEVFDQEASFHAVIPVTQNGTKWFRRILEGHRAAFCTSPTDPMTEEASIQVGISHIRSHVPPSWYVGIYHLIFDAYHCLEGTPGLLLPSLPTVRKRWLLDLKMTLDTYESVLSSQIDSLNSLALRDALTGLLNRRGFWERVTEDIHQDIPRSAFIIVDLDFFKQLNDENGHPFGDRILQRFASIAKSHTRGSDAIARLGGDEFAAWIPNIKSLKPIAARITHISRTAASQCRISFSAGLSIFPDDDQDITQLYEAADKALYRAKESGRRGLAMTSEVSIHSLSVPPI